MKLVIVESPAKAQTISKFLGNDYKVVASYGHIRDLPGSADEIPAAIKSEPWARLAVNIDKDFEPVYVVPKDSKKQMAELKKLMKQANEIILATDEDREGESISWHLIQVLNPDVPVKRIAFHEITRHAIEEALDHPREVNEQLVRAQEGRRVLDRLFGYSLSPVLWKKVRPKLSAGRVQSVAVRLVVEREEERKRFKKSEYWDLEATLRADDLEFTAQLVTLDAQRLATGKDFDSGTGKLASEGVVWLRETESREIADDLERNLPWRVASVEQKETRLKPDPPFITSSLQRAASSLLGFSPRRTMQIAQQLYEGMDLGGGEREGLITYMRTDSVALSDEALRDTAAAVDKFFGKEYHERRTYTTKSKMAQEAHEAIRPTHLARKPETVKGILSDDQLRLYRLIWNRTMASQMADAKLLKTTIEFAAKAGNKTATLRANGSVVKFPGFLRVADRTQKDTELPSLKEGDGVGPGQRISLERVEPLQHETKPPARYTEASLIQRLEEEGIGRPSTYAPTLSTIQQRGYVELEGKALVPTFLAVATTRMLRDHFSEYIDLGFTAHMEDALDDIANGQQDSVEFLKEFYFGNGHFGHGLEPQIERELPRIEFPAIELGPDPDTGEPLIVRLGKTSPFIQRGEGGSDNTITVPQDVTYEELDAELAAHLLREKRKSAEPLGRHPDTGENIYALIGPYGPYVQLGEASKEKKKPKRASLPKGTSLADVELPFAVKLLSLPRELGEHPEQGEPVVAGIGPYGPYVKCGKEFRSLEESDDVYTVGFERALELLAQPKKSRRRTKRVIRTLEMDSETGKPIQVLEGRYGPYVSDGKVNASLPKDISPEDVTIEDAKKWLAESANKPKRKRRTKKSATKKGTRKSKTKATKRGPAKNKKRE